ncbi:MAG: M36 family metallopeptidase, partial [Bryobacteraceae bacterium]
MWGQTVNLQKKRSLPDFDSRLQAASLEAPAVVRQNLAKEIVARRIADVESFVVSEQVARPGTRIVVSRQGLPQLYLRDGHALSAPSTREPEEIAKAFLREHAAVFPFAPGEVDQLSLTVKDVTQDATYLAFMQTLDGVPVFEGQIKFTLSAAGEVIQVGCGDVMPGLNLSTKPALSPDEAAEKAGASVGGKGTLSRAPELVIFPLDASTARLAWRVFMDVDPDGSHEILVDAEDGRLLYRHSLQVFDGAQCAQGQTPGACVWTKSPMQSARAWVPFPAGWIPVGGSVTTGNNADAYLDADGNDSPDNVNTAGMQIGRAYSPTQAFNFTFGDGTLGLDPRNYQAAAVTNLFYFLNMAHDHYYGLGFTEAAGNFQTDNFGRGGVGNDAVLGEAQYGGFTDNSSFSPKPDGTAPRLSMGLYTRSTSSHTDDLDADYAGQTAFHEYGHGVSNRLVGARVNMSCLYQVQSGAMGEGWSDYFAISYYNDPVYGYYQTQNATHGLRRQSYEGYTFTYEDIGNGANGYEVHDDGEIWAATLWDLRKSLGQAVTDQLVMNGLKSTPCNPSMTDARDAILSADQAANGGANRASIWAVFARHGMGYSASGSDGGVITGTVYNAAYDQPPDLQAARNPAITSTPPGVVGLGDSYSYPVTASNPNNGVLSFALSSGPAGMTIDSATGAIRWTAGFTGPQRVKVTVTDGKGGKVVHGYLLPVMTRLTAGAPMVISGTTGSAGLAYLDVPAGVPVLQVTLRGSTGDADLAVLDPDGHFAVSVRVGSTETLSFANPAQGLWEIEVDGYMAYSGVSLMAALVTPAPLAVNATLTGLSGVLGSETLYRITIPSGTAAFSVSTSGGAGDVDLYLRQGKPAVCQVALFAVVETCLYDLKSFNYGNADTITVTSPAVGDWYLDLSGYAAYSGVTLTTSTPGTLSITTPSPLPSGSAGAAYSQSLAASGGVPPYTWSITSGALPVGLALSSAGVIAGTPTTAGNYSFTVRVADSASAAATQTFSLTISGLPPTITTSSTLPSGFTGWTYSQTLAAAGGVPPYTWSITSGALPAGLALSSAGVIAGTPTAAGNYSFTVRVTDSASAAATQPFSLTVAAAPSLVRAGTLSHIAAGGDWDTTISLITTSSAPVAVRLVFHADDGSALSLPLSVTQQGVTQSVTTATLDRVINPKTTLVIDAGPGLASLVWGWADVLSSGAVSGFAIFRTKCPTCTASEGTVPLQSSFQSTLIVPYDNTANFVTGV